MVATPTQQDPFRRRKHRRSGAFAPVRAIWRRWWVEILVGALVVVAVFLLVEKMSIRATLYAWLLKLLDGLQSLAVGTGRGIAAAIQRTTLSDLVGCALLITAAGLIVWRTRQRLMSAARFTALKCPACGSELHRVRRQWYHRVLNIYVPVRRYQCKNRDCQWRGLRVRTGRYD
jgi:hypothetical protein